MLAIQQQFESFFREKGQLIRYKKHSVILHPGDVPQGVHYITRGFARLYNISPEGKELTLVIYQPGEIFPVVWTVKGDPSIYYFEPMTDLTLLRASREDFVKFITHHPDIFFEFTRGITSRFQLTLKRMGYLTFGNSHAKIASALLILVERYGKRLNDHSLIRIPLTHRDIAALVGLTRETVSLELKKLEKKGYVVKRKGRYIIKDVQGLQTESLLAD